MRKYNKDLFGVNIVGSTTSDIINLEDCDSWSIQHNYSGTATISAQTILVAAINATADTFTVAGGHGFVTGLKVAATTSGTLPAPLTATNYYIVVVSSTVFKVATSLANALAGITVDLTDVGVTNAIFTPAALAGATITAYKSNNGTTWTALAQPAPITVASDTETWWHEPLTTTALVSKVSYAFLKIVATCTAGTYLLSSKINVETKSK
jgi:hypothetical protein